MLATSFRKLDAECFSGAHRVQREILCAALTSACRFFGLAPHPARATTTQQRRRRQMAQNTRGGSQDQDRGRDQGGTSNRGFASMDDEKQRAIAAEGGRAAHAQGTAHEFDSEEARAAGRKGGQARSSRSAAARAASMDRDIQGGLSSPARSLDDD